MKAHLECARCQAVYPIDQIRYVCDCGGLLDVNHDLEALRKAVTRATFDARTAAAPPAQRDPLRSSGVWRYHEMVLPVDPKHIVSRPEGKHASVQPPALVGLGGNGHAVPETRR